MSTTYKSRNDTYVERCILCTRRSIGCCLYCSKPLCAKHIQNLGISLNNKYYTFKHGEIWEQYSNAKRNNFYKSWDDLTELHYNSTVNFIFNDGADVVKTSIH